MNEPGNQQEMNAVEQHAHRSNQQAPAGRQYARPPQPRKSKLPIILFLLTCISTFWVGIYHWHPPSIPFQYSSFEEFFMGFRIMLLKNWDQGLIYMACVLLILLLHEFGHFFTTIYYKVPATSPMFLPFPLNPIGTLGAVIGMEGTKANRKQIFDIGIAGPLAGLVAAVPLAYIGIAQLDLSVQPQGGMAFRLPLMMQWLAESYGIEGYDPTEPIVWLNQLNPYLAAAWVGLLVTGLNMMPVGQLDGGHISYTLFGKQYSGWLADAMVIFAIAYIVFYQTPILILMVLLILVMGTHHPPTADDTVPIGLTRRLIGMASLAIPIFCFPPLIFKFVE